MTAARPSRIASSLVALLSLAACSREAGQVSVVFTWGPDGPPTTPGAALFARVSEPPSGDLESARTVAAAAPVLLGAAREVLLPEVPYGEARVVVVEVRESLSADSELLRYGVSAPFALRLGEKKSVTVEVPLRRPPAARGGVTPDATLIRTATVGLRLTTDSGVRAELSNFETFPSSATRCVGLGRAIEGCATAEPSACVNGRCTYSTPWDVNFALGDTCGLDGASERQDRCTRRFFARFVDERGVASTITSADLVLDTRPPGLEGAALTYTPAPGSPLAAVGAARLGATVAVTLVARELIRPLPERILANGPGGRALELARVPDSVSAVGARYLRAIDDPTLPEGDYVLAPITVIDLAGNAADLAPALAPITLSTSPATLVLRQDRVSHVRAPRGVFELGPSDPLDPATELPLDTFRVRSATAAAIRVYADAAGQDVLVPLVTPSASGWPRGGLRLPALDAPRVYVAGFDRAGNESVPVLVENGWYVGAPVITTSEQGLAPSSTQGAVDAALVAEPDGRSVTRGPGLAWRSLTSGRPAFFSQAACAWDASRGAIVYFGLQPTPSTWTWDGYRFLDVTPSANDLAGDYSETLVYDRARDRVVALSAASGRTWEWDGRSWREVLTAHVPPVRGYPAMGYDPLRRKVVLFGGTEGLVGVARTWLYDGVDWTEVTPPSGNPPGRYASGMAFDAARGVMLLFGGATAVDFDMTNPVLGDTWAWDGARWTELASTGAAPRASHSLVYDEGRGRVVLHGGSPPGNDWDHEYRDTWEWDGARWIEAPSTPDVPSVAASCYDGAVGRVTAYGGVFVDQFEAEGPLMRSWDGARWRRLGGPDAPSARTDSALAYDARRDRVVLFGGRSRASPSELLGDTWEWDGGRWTRTATSGPAPRQEHAMAFDAARGVTVLFSGSGAGADTWTWDGTRWTQVTATGPTARHAASLVHDAARGELVLFGGYGNDGGFLDLLGDTWLWNGTGWRAGPSQAGGPPARAQSPLAYDPVRERVVMFGGVEEARTTTTGIQLIPGTDTWEWDGTRWSALGTAGPPVRVGQQLFYAPSLRATVLYAGGRLDSGDLLRWDGAAWTALARPQSGPPLRGSASLVVDGQGPLLLGGNVDALDAWRLTPVLPEVQATLTLPGDVALDALGALRVRAWCGSGARLVGWDPSDQGTGADRGWKTLARGAAILEHSGSDARRFVYGRSLAFQCRADTDVDVERSSVTLDHAEIRVAYRVR